MIGGVEVDRFIEGSAANGSDLMVGGGERADPLDFFYHGDEVSYARRVKPIRADLEGDRDDGERGERDQIGSDVESIVGDPELTCSAETLLPTTSTAYLARTC